MVKSADAPHDLKELIAYAKANPGKLNIGVPGNGTLGHITSELVQKTAGGEMTNVPYQRYGAVDE